MQQVTASEFISWKQDPVTKAFFMAIIDRIEEAKETLSIKAGFDTAEDNYFRGFIRAYREALDFRIDDLQEAVDGN